MARCKGCMHDSVCNGDVGHGYSVCPHYINTADVAPRAEIAKELLAIIAQRQHLIRMKEEGVCDTYHSGYYSGKLLAYEDVKNIIEKKYLEDQK